MIPVRWKLWYADGSSYSHLDGPWGAAPTRGVIALVTKSNRTGREIGHSFDYYLWFPGQAEPSGVDPAGLWDFLHEIEYPKMNARLENKDFSDLEGLGVKFGRTVTTAAFQGIISLAHNDPDFPQDFPAPQ